METRFVAGSLSDLTGPDDMGWGNELADHRALAQSTHILAIRKVRGNSGRTRTPMACKDATFRRSPTRRCNRTPIFEGYERLHRALLQVVQHDAVCCRLLTVPGVGPVAALSFKSGDR